MEKGFEGNKDRYPKLHIRQSQAAIEKFINEQITPVMTKKERTMETKFEVGNRVRGKKSGDEYTIVEDGNKWFLKRDNGELFHWINRTHNVVELIEPAAKKKGPSKSGSGLSKPNGSVPKEVKNLAQKMGISIKGATEAIQRLSQRGISGVEAGKQMRKALQKITEQPESQPETTHTLNDVLVNFPTTKTTERYYDKNKMRDEYINDGHHSSQFAPNDKPVKLSTARMRDDYIKERELPTTETTHTFSAELPDGQIVEMPSPGDDWEKGETEEFQRGDRRVRMTANLRERKHYNFYTFPTYDKFNNSIYIKIIDNGACWAKEMVGSGAPILSITTWTREIPNYPEKPESSFTYRDASEDNHIGLEIWPGREDQQRHDAWNAIPHTHREPSSYNTRCLEAWPERDCEVE